MNRSQAQRVLIAVACIVLLAVTTRAQSVRRADGVKVHFDDGLEGAADRVLELFLPVKRKCTERLGFALPREVTIHVVRDHEAFNELVVSLGAAPRPPFVAAVAFSRADLIVLKSEAWRRQRQDSLEDILLHELAHVFLGHVERTSRLPVPRWFDEGVAQWVTRRVFLGPPDVLERAYRKDRLLSLDALTKSFPEQEGASALAYAQSLSLVRFISHWNATDEDKRRNIPAILRLMIQGKRFPDALENVTGKTLKQLEAAWRGDLKNLPSGLLRQLPDFVFGGFVLVAALLILARLRVKRARRLAQFDAEEEE